ncbi:MAG: DUF5711 family protein [Oscillospiraceae bacterium]|jgi:hypothetical protein|nr:DUF5711 family protein [Oscillospiraceae bacterium]
MRKAVTYALLCAAVLLAVLVFAVFRDDIGGDALGSAARWFSREGEAAGTERIPFGEGRDTVLALCDGRLAALSADRFVLYDKSGREKVSRALSFEIPGLTVAGGKAVAYDRAGGSAFVADAGGVRAEFDVPVLTAAGNARGQYVLVTAESGYRGVAQMYDGRDRPVYKWYSAERYIWAASLSPSGRRMAVAAVGPQDGTVSTRVTFLEPGRGEPLGSADIEDEVPLAAHSPDNNHVCIIAESGVYFYTDDGLPLARYSYGGSVLLSAHATGEALFLHLGRGEGGQYSRLVCLSYTGAELGQARFTEGPYGLAAGERWCAALEAGVLTRYTLEGTELKTEVLGPSGARGLLVGNDGNILLLFSGYGEWYNERERETDPRAE